MAGIFSGTKQGGRAYQITGRYGTESITLVLYQKIKGFLLCVALSVLGLLRLGYLADVNEECVLIIGKQKNFGHVSYNVLDIVKEHSTIEHSQQ